MAPCSYNRLFFFNQLPTSNFIETPAHLMKVLYTEDCWRLLYTFQRVAHVTKYLLKNLVTCTFISSSPWGAIVPVDGEISNSIGEGKMVLPTSLRLLSSRLLSWLCISSLAQPSAGTRNLNVMGIRAVFTRVHYRAFTKPASWNVVGIVALRYSSDVHRCVIDIKMIATMLKSCQRKTPNC